MPSKQYPLDIHVEVTVIATGDKIVDRDVETYGGKPKLAADAVGYLVRDSLRDYGLRVSNGEIDLKGQDKPPGEIPGDDRIRKLRDEFVAGAFIHLRDLGYPDWPAPDVEDEARLALDVENARRELISDFVEKTKNIPLEDLLERFKETYTAESLGIGAAPPDEPGPESESEPDEEDAATVPAKQAPLTDPEGSAQPATKKATKKTAKKATKRGAASE